MDQDGVPSGTSTPGLQGYVDESLREEETFHFLAFESLHRLNIVQLQNRLATLKCAAKQTSLSHRDLTELQTTLHAHTTAIKDYSYLKSQQPVAFNEANARKLRLKRYFPELNQRRGRPFDSHYHYADADAGPGGGRHTDSVRSTLRSILPASLTYSDEERNARHDEFLAHKPAHGVSTAVDRAARLIVALLGGVFLLVPMIVMVFSPSTAKSVATTSAAVILFATSLAFGIRATNVETMVSTATYAAVLVVFVGSNNNNSNGSAPSSGV